MSSDETVAEALCRMQAENAELRECLKDACNAELSCKECKSPCYVYTQDDCPIKKMWRKALEGEKNESETDSRT